MPPSSSARPLLVAREPGEWHHDFGIQNSSLCQDPARCLGSDLSEGCWLSGVLHAALGGVSRPRPGGLRLPGTLRPLGGSATENRQGNRGVRLRAVGGWCMGLVRRQGALLSCCIDRPGAGRRCLHEAPVPTRRAARWTVAVCARGNVLLRSGLRSKRMAPNDPPQLQVGWLRTIRRTVFT